MAEGDGGGSVNCKKEVDPTVAGGDVHLVDGGGGHLLAEEGRETHALLRVDVCEGGGDISG